jgi:pyridoxamine 5'-phosphate oxidase
MTRSEIFQFLSKNPACHLATVDGNNPHVRGILIYRADENGIILHTGTTKDLYNQLMSNPNVEFCFNDFQNNIQVRISGVAESVNDQKLKEEIVANRPFMKPWIEQFGYDFLAVFRIKKLVAVVWTLQTNFKKKKYIEVTD